MVKKDDTQRTCNGEWWHYSVVIPYGLFRGPEGDHTGMTMCAIVLTKAS